MIKKKKTQNKMLTETRRQTSKIITAEHTVDRQIIGRAKVQDTVKRPDSLDRVTSDSNHSQSIKKGSSVTSSAVPARPRAGSRAKPSPNRPSLTGP